MKYKTYNFDTYTIHTIKTDKFKNCHMEITFYDNAKREELAIRNFLVDMCCHSSLKYKKRKDLVIELENLYQAYFYGVSTKVGNMVLSSFVLDFLNPYYVTDKKYLQNVLKLPFEVLENPNIENNAFDERTFKIIQKRILKDIDSLKENPANLTFSKALLAMDKDSITSASVLGTKEEVLKITPENLYEYYKKFYEKSLCNIYIIGDLDMDLVVSYINKFFHNNCLKNHSVTTFVDNKIRKKELIVKEKGPFLKTNLVMGFNLDKLTKEELFITLYFFDEILCAGGLKSKIYNSLREENTLCYSVSSINAKYDNMYYIYVALEEKNVPLAIKLIKKEIKNMASGNISEEEMNIFRKQLLTSLDIVMDNQDSLINNYTFNTIAGFPLLETLKDKYEKITIKDLKNLGKKLKLNFVYELQGKGEENEGN